MDIFLRDVTANPILGELARLVFRCVLVGDLPYAKSRLPLGARVRVRLSFAPFANERVQKDFFVWMENKSMTFWFLAREFLFFHISNNFVLERVLGDSRKWSRFVAIVRITIAEIRRDIAAQVARGGDISWEDIERTEFEYRDKKGKDTYGTSGRIKDRHERSLYQFNKLKKGRFEEIFKRKTKAIESSLGLHYEEAWTFLQSENRNYYCHLVAWYLAQRSHSAETPLKWQLVIETRWFKALGMSREGLALFRDWIFEYYEYDTGDNGMKSRGIAFFKNNWRDYVIARVMCRLIELYRDQTPFFLPLDQTLRQIHALRASLGIEPWFATPPQLGRHMYCQGCHQWATTVAPHDLVLAGELRPTLEAYEALKARSDARGTSAATNVGRLHSKPVSASDAARLAFGSNANEAAVASFRAAYMDPLDGRLYCRRGHFKPPTHGNGEDDEQAPQTALDAAAAAGLGVTTDSTNPAMEDAIDAPDPFDDLALGRVDPVRWLKAHAAKGTDPAETGFHRTAAKSPFATAETGSAITRIEDVTVLAVSNFSCNNPLVEVCLLGTYWRLHGRMYGLCVFCGRACEVINCNKTSLGLSCGKHALADTYASNHRTWLGLGITRAEVVQTFANPAPRRPCFACRRAPATRFVEAYDFMHQLFLVPLCAHHFLCLGSLIPMAPRLGEGRGPVVVASPLRIDHVMERVWANV